MKKEKLMRKVYYMLPSEIKQVKKTAKEKGISESRYIREKLGLSTGLLV